MRVPGSVCKHVGGTCSACALLAGNAGQRSGDHVMSQLDARVLLVDDDPFTRVMLRANLEGMGFESITDASSAREALDRAVAFRPKIGILDLDLGEGPTGIDLAHALRRLIPHIGILMLSTYSDPRYIGSNQQDLPDGALYLVKRTVSDDSVLRAALEELTSAQRGSGAFEAPPLDGHNLSASQIEVMRYIAAGLTNSEIATRLVIEEGSVEKSIARIIKQLGIKADRTQNQRVLISREYLAMIGIANARKR